MSRARLSLTTEERLAVKARLRLGKKAGEKRSQWAVQLTGPAVLPAGAGDEAGQLRSAPLASAVALVHLALLCPAPVVQQEVRLSSRLGVPGWAPGRGNPSSPATSSLRTT